MSQDPIEPVTSDFFQTTLNYYDDSAEMWASSRDTAGYWGNQMNVFRKHLPAGRILEIGLGTGRDAAELIDLGYEYTGIEPSQGMIELAGQRDLNGRLIQQGVQDLEFVNEFDGFWAAASLLHRRKSEIDSDLQKINRAVKPGAIGTIIIKKYIEGSGPDERVEQDDFGERFFAYWNEEEFAEVLRKNGFELIEDTVVDKRSEKSTFLIYTIRKITEA